eukprot:TRINITY_DN84284_c0_g1_i1.p1 TRINITY_DN84284_c0_g1~~TRINITY_DN84284_c0_g1_i1.p1  ORF type:complete len:503 (-),score=68.69 TRINITY_DN84284_c0_g1_i1:128-1636(-)
MDTPPEISIRTFDGTRPVNTPLSLHVCRMKGILPTELVKQKEADFHDQGLSAETGNMYYDFFENNRQAKLNMIQEEYKKAWSERLRQRARQEKRQQATTSLPDMKQNWSAKVADLRDKQEQELVQMYLSEVQRRVKVEQHITAVAQSDVYIDQVRERAREAHKKQSQDIHTKIDEKKAKTIERVQAGNAEYVDWLKDEVEWTDWKIGRVEKKNAEKREERKKRVQKKEQHITEVLDRHTEVERARLQAVYDKIKKQDDSIEKFFKERAEQRAKEAAVANMKLITFNEKRERKARMNEYNHEVLKTAKDEREEKQKQEQDKLKQDEELRTQFFEETDGKKRRLTEWLRTGRQKEALSNELTPPAWLASAVKRYLRKHGLRQEDYDTGVTLPHAHHTHTKPVPHVCQAPRKPPIPVQDRRVTFEPEDIAETLAVPPQLTPHPPRDPKKKPGARGDGAKKKPANFTGSPYSTAPNPPPKPNFSCKGHPEEVLNPRRYYGGWMYEK